MKNYELFLKNTRAIVYDLQANAIQKILVFDYVCQREKHSVAAIVNPTRGGLHKVFFGKKEILL